MKKAKHLNIVRLFHVHDTDEYLYLIIENASGGGVIKYMNKLINERMTEDDARDILQQIVSALRYLHEKKHIVHR